MAAKASKVLSEEERAAMKELVKERRASKADGESDLLEKIAEMPPSDRAMAERIHAIVKATAPELSPRTWYGMPAYGKEGGPALCFFQAASKFKARYATFGFNNEAKLDDGEMWPVAFALLKMTPAVEKRIAELVKKAVS